uniref:Uncharacterized protein n=1 Tax=Opuntia streptacantha TaxID=393608 RepID=A0A7C8ZT67_OPUST
MATKSGTACSTYSPSTQKRKHEKPNFKDPSGVRSDGRGFHQCRPAYLRTGAVNSAAGSAYAEFGNTKVIVSVFGPRESKKAMMYSDIGKLNCSVSYTTFATPVRGQASVGANLIIDPLLEEESCQDGSLMLTYMPSRTQVTQLTITGEWTTPKIHEGMELCLDGCKKLGMIIRSCLKEAASSSENS